MSSIEFQAILNKVGEAVTRIQRGQVRSRVQVRQREGRGHYSARIVHEEVSVQRARRSPRPLKKQGADIVGA